jgi:hypothetical protein
MFLGYEALHFSLDGGKQVLSFGKSRLNRCFFGRTFLDDLDLLRLRSGDFRFTLDRAFAEGVEVAGDAPILGCDPAPGVDALKDLLDILGPKKNLDN